MEGKGEIKYIPADIKPVVPPEVQAEAEEYLKDDSVWKVEVAQTHLQPDKASSAQYRVTPFHKTAVLKSPEQIESDSN